LAQLDAISGVSLLDMKDILYLKISMLFQGVAVKATEYPLYSLYF